ncbi:MAG: helix-turn-helix domain-containing protein [Clostridia bacterium]|nr:helix-turn-helix domain-containing protein [Clostridia bacterium]
MDSNILSAKEAAKYLGISYWLILELVRKKEIPHTKLSSKIIFRKESLDNYLLESEQKSVKKEIN